MGSKLPIVIVAHGPEHGKKRVAAYCRVSSLSAEQLHSYEAQTNHYRQQFESDSTVVFIGVYGDVGISGTRTANRDGFMRMIGDCRQGLIDCIWTKSVSRFGRNTVDTLIYTRELRSLGIDVYFEKENIHSLEPAGELLLTLMAAFAESESANMSDNIKWGKRRRYEQGLVESITVGNMIGFRQKNGEVTVDEAEADIVRGIFRDYLDGYSMAEIARRLNSEAVSTRMGGSSWSITLIRHVLENEKYSGDCILQKTFIADPITHRSVPNRGQFNKYIVEGCYPAIIGKLEWQVVQELRSRGESSRLSSSEERPFVGRLFCAVCGKAFNTAPTFTTGRELLSQYRCVSRKDHSGVEVPGMEYVRPHTVRYTKNPTPALVAYRERYYLEPEPRPYLCSDTRIEIGQPARGFVQAWNQMVSKRQRYIPMLQSNADSEDVVVRYFSARLSDLIQNGERLKEFDTRLFRRTVERIDVNPTGKLTYRFKAGIKITV